MNLFLAYRLTAYWLAADGSQDLKSWLVSQYLEDVTVRH